MRKGRVIKDFLQYKKGDIIDIYSLEEIAQKEKQLLLVKNCLNYCVSCVQVYRDNMLGFILYEVKHNKQDYLFLSKKNEYVELLEEKNEFKKTDLKTGDILALKNGTYLLFVNKQIGFVNIKSKNEQLQQQHSEFRYIAFREDLSHFRGKQDFEIVKIYRFKTNTMINEHIINLLPMADVVFENKKIIYCTLKEASQSNKRFKHKDCKFYSNDVKLVLNNAFKVTGQDLFYLIEAKEYEVEE